MDKPSRKRPPPIAAIYTYRRSSTSPFCRITGKSHSMDEHHYVPCSDDFPKFDRLSGCRITEKHEYFKDYKHAYPIIDLDGTTRMVTEHDFHCRITAKYRAMAGHKYLYPVLGSTTDKTVNDMTSVAEDEAMHDVIVPSEVELIVRGGVEDVLRLKDSDYLFIYGKEGSIIPAALKEIRGKGGIPGPKGRRHTLPVGLEAGVTSDLEEFRRSIRVKMLSEIKQKPVEVADPPSGLEIFDKIMEEVEILKDVRKSRPKKPGKNRFKGGKIVSNTREKQKINTTEVDFEQEKENLTITTNDDIDMPLPKLSRLDKYKLQFSAFESCENRESGNRLTLVGGFDENEVVELDFGEPTKLQYSDIKPIGDGVPTPLVADISEDMILPDSNAVDEFDAGEHNSANTRDNGGIGMHNKNISKLNSKISSYLSENNDSDNNDMEIGFSSKNSFKSWKSIENLNDIEDQEMNDNHLFSFNGRQEHKSESLNGIIEIDETVDSDLQPTSAEKKRHVNEEPSLRNNIEIPDYANSSPACIIPKKISSIPHSAISRNLMNELKSKLATGGEKKKKADANNKGTYVNILKDENIILKSQQQVSGMIASKKRSLNNISVETTGEINEISYSNILYNNNNFTDLSNKTTIKNNVDSINKRIKIQNLLEQNGNEPKLVSQNDFPICVDSHSPFFETDTSTEERAVLTTSLEFQKMLTRLPVTCKIVSEEITCATEEQQWQGIEVYVAIMDFKPMGSDEEAVSMKEGQRVEIIDASKPRRWLVRTIPMNSEESPSEGWVPACYLEKSTAYETLSSYVVTEAELDPKELEAMQNREAIVKELVETEEDFAKDMQYVVENYYKQMDNPRIPKEFKDRKGSVFSNFKDISDFHNNVLMKGVNYHAKEPTKLGKTFLRLERDFDMHASYCWNEARAQKLLKEGPLKEFFDDHSKMIDDDKLLVDHLKLPIQRLNDYQLLLKELIKYSSRLKEDTADLQKALDFIHSINTRTKDLQYIQVMEGCQGDLLKIGRIMKHDIFDVNEGSEVSSSERYVFLFKGRVFVTEKRIASDKESYHVTNLFKLQDVELVENVDGDPLKILFRSQKKSRLGFPLSLRARSLDQKITWLKELASSNQVVEDLGDLEPSLEHPLIVSSTELITEKTNDTSEQAESVKTVSLKRQESVKKAQKTPDSSAPQTPTDTDNSRPSLKRQESVKKSKKSGETSAPETPTESSEKPPKLSRQDYKKSKSSEPSAPETPTEVSDKPPTLLRQDSKKSTTSDTSAPETPIDSSDKPSQLLRQDSKQSKSSDTSAPETPIESSEKPPQLVRQESKQSKSSDTSVPQTPTETVTAPPFTRQDSVKKKPKKQSVSEKEVEPAIPITEANELPPLTRQESLSKKEKKTSVTDKRKADTETAEEEGSQTKLARQDSLSKKDQDIDKKKPKQGEEHCDIPSIIMSEDASGSDARMESAEFGEDNNTTLASESLRSDDSVTPTGSGAYANPSYPSSPAYYHVLILIPVLCACYVFTQVFGDFSWN